MLFRSPRGVIQSRMAPLRLLVSSDRALDAPFWICGRSVCEFTPRNGTYEVCNVDNTFMRSIRQAPLKSWYHQKQGLKYFAFSLFSAHCVNQLLHDDKLTNSGVSVSSGSPSSSPAPMRWMPLFNRVLIEQNAW